MNLTMPAALTAILCLSACTTTTGDSLAVSTDAGPFLTAQEISEQIVGNTISGIAVSERGDRIPYQQHFSATDNRYRDRVVFNGQVTKANGTFHILDNGTICSKAPIRRNGSEACIRYQRQGTDLIAIDVSQSYQFKPAIVTVEPGLTF